MLAIETRNLQKRYQARVKLPGLRASLKALARSEYREVDAVRGVNLAVERGETLACIGPNGAGKSTLIKMLTGILYPSDGEARVLGLAPQTERQALSRRIGAVFGQKSLLWYHLPAADSFELLGAIYDLDRQTLKARTQSLVREFELEEFFLTPVRKLSLGQRMRCEIAASLLHAPELLFLDEPTIGLDVVAKRKIRECILRMNHAQGVTVFLTSHDPGDVEALCRRAMVLDAGAVVFDGTVEALRRAYWSERRIRVRYAEEGAVPPLPMARRTADGEYLLETSADGADAALRSLIAAGPVADVTVEEPSMESILNAYTLLTEGMRNAQVPHHRANPLDAFAAISGEPAGRLCDVRHVPVRVLLPVAHDFTPRARRKIIPLRR